MLHWLCPWKVRMLVPEFNTIRRRSKTRDHVFNQTLWFLPHRSDLCKRGRNKNSVNLNNIAREHLCNGVTWLKIIQEPLYILKKAVERVKMYQCYNQSSNGVCSGRFHTNVSFLKLCMCPGHPGCPRPNTQNPLGTLRLPMRFPCDLIWYKPYRKWMNESFLTATH